MTIGGIAEYALRDLKKPVGVASHVAKLVGTMPVAFRGQLPDPKQLKDALNRAEKTPE